MESVPKVYRYSVCRLQSVIAEQPWDKDMKPSRKKSPGGFNSWEYKERALSELWGLSTD
jgi:hypothetical protein